MKFYIVSRGDEFSNQIKEELAARLSAAQLNMDKEEPDIAISVGGDGTLLDTFHRYKHRLDKTAFLGIHTGHLGFYADWQPKELDELITHLTSKELKTVSYPLLEMVMALDDQSEERYLALNECTVKTRSGSLVVTLEINGDTFETFRGDGLCISTPSGSTAYNKSLGGAIIHPSLCAIQITEMASINNRVYRTIGSPLVLPAHHQCVLKPGNVSHYVVTVDHVTLEEKRVRKITLQVADEKIHFARYRPFPFWQRVKEAFI